MFKSKKIYLIQGCPYECSLSSTTAIFAVVIVVVVRTPTLTNYLEEVKMNVNIIKSNLI